MDFDRRDVPAIDGAGPQQAGAVPTAVPRAETAVRGRDPPSDRTDAVGLRHPRWQRLHLIPIHSAGHLRSTCCRRMALEHTLLQRRSCWTCARTRSDKQAIQPARAEVSVPAQQMTPTGCSDQGALRLKPHSPFHGKSSRTWAELS
jgi:hypothetical protein